MNKMLRFTNIVHSILAQFLEPGNVAVDATAGNGFDTVFLARKVGADGRVYAFDIQERALATTQKRLLENRSLQQVKLIHDSHDRMIKYVNEPVQVVTYNLGYLPGGDKSIVTQSEDTVNSLMQAMELLAVGGVISIIVYRGHKGAQEESNLVESLLSSLEFPLWHVMKWENINGSSTAPYLIMIFKQGS